MIPIYRAKEIDSDNCFIGYYVDTVDLVGKTLKNKNGYISYQGEWKIIDKSTLEISFDDGKSFLKLSDLDIKTCKTFDMVYICEKNRQHREKQIETGKVYTIITDKGV